MRRKIDYDSYIGKKVNRLTVKSFYRDKSNVFFLCDCECGKEKPVIAYRLVGGITKSCGCLLRENGREKAREMGLATRKYEEKCTFCGKNEHYAKGYCVNCYNRLMRKGRVEYKELLHKKIIPLSDKQLEKALDIIYLFTPTLTKNNIIGYDSLSRFKKGRRPRFETIKKCFDFVGLDIFEELNIEDKYKDKRVYRTY